MGASEGKVKMSSIKQQSVRERSHRMHFAIEIFKSRDKIKGDHIKRVQAALRSVTGEQEINPLPH